MSVEINDVAVQEPSNAEFVPGVALVAVELHPTLMLRHPQVLSECPMLDRLTANFHATCLFSMQVREEAQQLLRPRVPLLPREGG